MSFAGHRFTCRFVNGFPHFRHTLLLSMLRLGSFLIWLWELKDLKAGPLVEDCAMLVSFWWLKYPFHRSRHGWVLPTGLAWRSKVSSGCQCSSRYKWKYLLSIRLRQSPLYYKYSPSPSVLPRIVHMISVLSVCGLTDCTSRTLC